MNGKVKGLGSAREGTHHFWLQRMTAVIMLVLIIFVICSLLSATGKGYEGARAVIGQPVFGSVLLLFLATAFLHAVLGLQIVIEDYISNHLRRMLLVILMRLAAAGLAIAAFVSVLMILVGA